jgi:hypothetical protein
MYLNRDVLKVKNHFDAMYTPLSKNYVSVPNKNAYSSVKKYKLWQLRYNERSVVVHMFNRRKTTVEICEPKEYINTCVYLRGDIRSIYYVYEKHDDVLVLTETKLRHVGGEVITGTDPRYIISFA